MDAEKTVVATGEVDSNTWGAWISRKRIVMSMVSFTCLIVYNLVVVRTRALDPLDLAQPQAVLGTSLVLLGLFIRSWSAGMLRKTEVLITSGPYALVRNPLYVGSFLMMFGFCLLMRDWLSFAFVAGPMALIYWFQVKSEETRLSKRFGESWSQYTRATGRFVPCNLKRTVFVKWSLNQWMKNSEYEAFIAALVALIALHWFYPATLGL